MTPTELIEAQTGEHRFRTDEAQMLTGGCAEPHQITKTHHKRQYEMEGTADTLAKALDDVLKDVNLQTQRRNA